MAGVIRNGNALVSAALFDDVIGKTLCSASYHINIHAVNAGTDYAAQSGRAELQVHIESLFNLILVAFYGAKLSFCGLVKIRV